MAPRTSCHTPRPTAPASRHAKPAPTSSRANRRIATNTAAAGSTKQSRSGGPARRCSSTTSRGSAAARSRAGPSRGGSRCWPRASSRDDPGAAAGGAAAHLAGGPAVGAPDVPVGVVRFGLELLDGVQEALRLSDLRRFDSGRQGLLRFGIVAGRARRRRRRSRIFRETPPDPPSGLRETPCWALHTGSS